MIVKKRTRRRPIIPINSMSDIAFLLLIFIMLISLINYRKEIKIEYPEALLQESVNSEQNLEIWVNRRGEIFHNGEMMTYLQTEALLADEIADNPRVRVHILADKGTEYRNVDQIMDILQLLQHRVVSLVVKEQR